MRKFLQVILDYLASFVGNTPQEMLAPTNEDNEYINTIQLALYKQSAIHVIYNNKSFTGEIVKFDPIRQRLILKNFKKNVTSIIQFKDIQQVTLVPNSVQFTQRQQ
ncbi:TPA: hypothetical protein TXL57_001944 [Streptococcus suis]|nr:hypothetical protein [Streptococcus suis]